MIRAYIVGDAAQIARFSKAKSSVYDRLVREMTRAVIDLQSKIRTEKLSGQVLQVGTGALRRSIHYKVLNEAKITGVVGTNLPYGAVHEYGGPVSIREHVRLITQVFGRQITPKEVTVRAHIANYPERSYLRTSLQEMMPDIRMRLKEALRGAME